MCQLTDLTLLLAVSGLVQIRHKQKKMTCGSMNKSLNNIDCNLVPHFFDQITRIHFYNSPMSVTSKLS